MKTLRIYFVILVFRNKIFAKQRSINSPTEEERKMVEEGTDGGKENGDTAQLAPTPRYNCFE